MISRRRYDLVFAIYLQSRGFAFALFEGWFAPVDWGVYDARGADKNARCLDRIKSLLALHAHDVLVLQGMSESGTRRAKRIRELNLDATELADQHGMLVRTYSRAQIIEYFEELGTVNEYFSEPANAFLGVDCCSNLSIRSSRFWLLRDGTIASAIVALNEITLSFHGQYLIQKQ